MNELEKFLQQAAQRMKERQQAAQQQARPRAAQPQQPQQPPVAQPPAAARSGNRQPPRKKQSNPPAYQGEVVEAEVVDLTPPEQGPNRLSKLDTRVKPGTTSISMADERMAEHLQQTFDHSVGKLPKKANQPQASSVVANEQTNRKIEVETQKQAIHWVTKLLQNPESLRSAFIASEIFKQRF